MTDDKYILMRQFAREIQHFESLYKRCPDLLKNAEEDLDYKIKEYLPKILTKTK